MNMQAMLKQAQKLKTDMDKTQTEINKMVFEGTSSLVTVKVDGTKKLLSASINAESLDKDDIEMLQDMFVIACNDAFKQVDKTVEEKMGVYTKGIPGLF